MQMINHRFQFRAIVVLLFLSSFIGGRMHAQSDSKVKNVLFFTPEIDPKVEEIVEATNNSFFSEVSDRFSGTATFRLIKTETQPGFDNPELNTIKEICLNNNSHYAVVPKIKFFKVGIGKYVLSSQVIVSMKLYDSNGNLISVHSYDSLRKNARILGSAENSVKAGTKGVLKDLIKSLRRNKTSGHT